MKGKARRRRVGAMLVVLALVIVTIVTRPESYQPVAPSVNPPSLPQGQSLAIVALDQLPVKGRAPATGYERTLFGNGWDTSGGCDTRNIILARDMQDEVVNEKCQVVSGVLHDPYTGREITFLRGAESSQKVQIDHVVALSDAWQKGAQQLTPAERKALANDPLELLAVEGEANQQKSNGDTATWLPPNKAFRCQYVARQIAVKLKYQLWVTAAERDAMRGILATCPTQTLPKGEIEQEVDKSDQNVL